MGWPKRGRLSANRRDRRVKGGRCPEASARRAIIEDKRLGAELAFIREGQLHREPERRSTRAPRRRDQHAARLFKSRAVPALFHLKEVGPTGSRQVLWIRFVDQSRSQSGLRFTPLSAEWRLRCRPDRSSCSPRARPSSAFHSPGAAPSRSARLWRCRGPMKGGDSTVCCRRTR